MNSSLTEYQLSQEEAGNEIRGYLLVLVSREPQLPLELNLGRHIVDGFYALKVV